MGGLVFTPAEVGLFALVIILSLLFAANSSGKLLWDWQVEPIRAENERLRKLVRGLDVASDAATAALERRTLTMVREALQKSLSETQVRTLYFDLGVDYDGLPGDTKEDKVRELISFFHRQDRIGEMIAVARSSHPHLAVWGQLAKGSA